MLLLLLSSFSGTAQTLNVPARAANAPTGSEFVNQITALNLTDRENAIYAQVINGNIPPWLRNLVLVSTNGTINGTNHSVGYYVTPDYVAVGSDTNYFLTPMTPLLAQRLAEALNCSMPTRKMVNDIWRKAPCHLAPSPIAPSPSMTTVPIFNQHNTTVRNQRFAVTNTFPLGTLTGGDKKDVVLSLRIYTNFASASITKPVVIYGWHRTDGSPIQPVYNGHEETYADYSHGIRLVQMNITVDGSPNTVTNVLTNPSLAALLSDEGVLPKPYYTIARAGPTITSQPYSRRVNPGANVLFTVAATGTATLRYQWLFNGGNLNGATNTTLSLTNVTAAQAGSYSVNVSNNDGLTASIPALLKINTSIVPVLFSDSFETNSSSIWNVLWGSGNAIADYTVNWAFDYGTNSYTYNGATYLIPPAPGSSGTTRGVKFTVNNNDTNAAIAGVNIYPKNSTFSGNYTLKFDMWMNYPGASGGTGTGVAGSTEHAIFGLNHTGARANWAATSSSGTDGLWFAAVGEGGTSRDYRAYLGNLAGIQTELIGSGSGLGESNNAAGVYPSIFPANRFESSGAPGKNWVEVEVRQVNGVISWSLEGTVVAQRTNNSTFTTGTVMLGYMDVFTSIAAPAKDAFVFFDNVRVEDLSGSTNQPPSIVVPPADQSCSVGDSIQFSVQANGTAPLSYQWFHDGVLITGAISWSVQLRQVQAGQSGQYSVVVSNSAGYASAVADLVVNSTGFQFTSIARDNTNITQLGFLGNEGESYVFEASTNLVSWQSIAVLSSGNSALMFGDPASAHLPYRFYRARSSVGYLLTDFEDFSPGTSALFNRPAFSGSTLTFVVTNGSDFSYVTNAFPAGNDSDRVLALQWSFNGTTNRWLRLTTSEALNIPNPTIAFNQALVFDVYSAKPIYIAVGLRETGTTAAIGSNGGTSGTIEWIGAVSSNPPFGQLVSAGQWVTLQFLIPLEPVRAFAGDGILSSASGKGTLEHLAITPVENDADHLVYVDNFRLINLTQ